MSTREFFLDNNIKIEKGDYTTGRDEGGESFVTITSGGVVKQGEQVARLYISEHDAWLDFETQLLRWLGGRRRIHLRSAPAVIHRQLFEWHGHEPSSSYWYYVACRLTAY